MYKAMKKKIDEFEMWIFDRKARICRKDKVTTALALKTLIKRHLLSGVKSLNLIYFICKNPQSF